jgi:hypothetical protein
MRRRVLAVLLAAASLGLAPGPSAAPLRLTTASSTSIPFELAMRHVIVQVRVNNSRPLSFILDTGADAAVIQTDVAKEIGLTLEGTVNTGGAGPGTQTGSLVKGATWSLVGLDKLSQPVAFALPLPELSASMGRNIDGIIGGTFIKQFVMELDYGKRAITLHDRTSFQYTGRGEALPLEFANGHPIVRATVTPLGGQPTEGRFVLDIGSGGALVLHSPFVAEQNLPGPETKTIRSIGAAGAGGRTVGRLGRVAALQLGSFTLQNPIAMFSEDKAGAFANPALAGNIGAQIAARFRLFFDYGRQRLILEPLDTLHDPFDRAFSGVAMRASGPDYGTFTVREVLEQSPATDAGIEVGDVLVSIDGTPARTVTLPVIYDMFEKPVSYALEIQRGQKVLNVTLTPRKMI